MNPKTQDQLILRAIDATRRCVTQLLKHELTVLAIQVREHWPIVIIQNSDKCRQLKGSLFMRRQGNNGMENVMIAELEDCRVQWIAPGR